MSSGLTGRKSASGDRVPVVHTGAEYERDITTRESDRRTRLAFQSLALTLATPGSVLFDFGAGTGLDARCFAEHGLRVRTYDTDPRMCAHLATFCGDLIESGQVTIEAGSYAHFLASGAGVAPPAQLITANFAPLNLVQDLPALFAKFHALTVPGGKVLASVLSPYFLGDMRYPWWWRNLPRSWRARQFAVPGAAGNILRRRLAGFSTQCAPHFRLARAFAGSPPARARQMAGIDCTRDGRTAWLRLTGCRYMFLLFFRIDVSPSGTMSPSNQS